MKVKSLINSLTKAGFDVKQSWRGQYYCYSKTHACTFYRNGPESEEAVCVQVRRKDDENNSSSDYSAGFFANTIKRVLEVLTNG